MSFFEELKRRNVFRVGIAYAVSAWVLLQVLDLVLEHTETPAWVMDVFFAVVALGFIVALVVAWAYEVTPEGIKRESEIDRSESVTHETAHKLDKITLAAIAALALLIIGDRFIGSDEKGPESSGQPAAGPGSIGSIEPDPLNVEQEAEEVKNLTPAKSIAVLPLANRSVNDEDAFFAEGIHDEILTRLSRIADLKVISRTSVMGYADTTKKMAEIGQELGVAHLLEGGVQRAGDRVRINVQLIEAETDKHLWAEIFDRELTTDNLFDIQSEITRSISDALQAVLTGSERLALEERPTDNLEAYAFYLRGAAKSQGYGRSIAEIEEGIEAYRNAISLDPRFAAAWAALSTDYIEKFWQGAFESDARERSFEALEKARELAPGAVETRVAEGYYHYWGHLDYHHAIAAFDQALSLDPGNILAMRGKAYVLRRLGRIDEGIDMLKQIISLDPLDAALPADLGYTLLLKGRMAEANEAFRRSIAQNPENDWSRWSYSEYFMILNNLERAQEVLASLAPNSDGWLGFQHFYLAMTMDDPESVLRAIDTMISEEDEDLARRYTRAQMKGMYAFTYGDLDDMHPELREVRDQMLTASKGYSQREERLLGSLVLINALIGDRDGHREALHLFETELKPDALRVAEIPSIAEAWAILGEHDKVMEQFEQIEQTFGIWKTYFLYQQPIFDGLRGQPRYKEMALRYDRWLETVK